jgi:flagellar biogenesis protein FliO
MFPPTGMLAATAAASNTDAHVSVFSLLARLLISLFIVLMVLWVLAQIVRRKGLPGSRGGAAGRAARRQVDVLNRQSLGKGQTLVTVRLDDRVVLLGVTAQNITTLSELDPAAYGIVPGAGKVLELEAVATAGLGRDGGSEHDDSDQPLPSDDLDLDPDLDLEPDLDFDVGQVRRLPSTNTSSTSASSTAASMTSTMFSWNQRLDRLRDRTVRH